MSDRKAIPLEKAIELWGMREGVKWMLKAFHGHLSIHIPNSAIKEELKFLIEKIDELEGER